MRLENKENQSHEVLNDDTDSELDEVIEKYGNGNDNLVNGNDLSGNVLLFF